MLELGICYLPSLYPAWIGIILLPAHLFALVTSSGENFPLIVTILWFSGIYSGLIPTIVAVKRILYGASTNYPPQFLRIGFTIFLFGLAFGPMGVFSIYGASLEPLQIAFSLCPIVCTIHIIYMARDILI